MPDQRLSRLVQDHGLSDKAFRALMHGLISDVAAENWSTEVLAREMGSSLGTASRVAVELESKGLLTRKISHRGKGEGRGYRSVWHFTP